MSLIRKVIELVKENWPSNTQSRRQPTSYWVDYYAITPRGTRTRFQRTASLVPMRMGASETGVQMYLKQLHRGCDIQIMNLQFR